MRVSARGALLCGVAVFLTSVTCRTFAYPIASYAGKFAAAYSAWWAMYNGGQPYTDTGFDGPFVQACLSCHSSDPTIDHTHTSNDRLNAYGIRFVNLGLQLPPDSEDTDGDGFTNKQEMDACTFPGDAASKPPGPCSAAAPTATDDQVTTPVNTATTINVTGNDTGGPFSSVQVAQDPAHGTAQASGLNIIYTPATGYTGADSFTYTVTNSSGTSTAATVTITVVQSQPVAQPDTASVAFNTATTLDVTSNDTGAPFTSVQVVQDPTHGTAQASGLNIIYTPAAGYSGADSFAYTVTNAAGTSAQAATVSLTVVAPTPPVAQDDQVVTAYNTTAAINVTANDTSVVPITSVQIVQGPAHGTVTVSGLTINYTPNQGYVGADTFTYTATSSAGTSNSPATVSITVQASPAPIANPDQAVTAYNTPTTVDVTSNDESVAPITSVQIVQAPAHGTATVSGLAVIYTPAQGYSGPDSFSYTGTSVGGTSNAASVSITVQARPGFRAGAIAGATGDETLKSTAQTLDDVCVTLDTTASRSGIQSTLYAVCRGLETDVDSGHNIDPALGSIRNEEAFAATDSSFDLARGISGNLTSRLNLLRNSRGTPTVDITNLTLGSGGPGLALMQSTLISALNSGLNRVAGSADHPDRAWGIWAAGNFQIGRRGSHSAGGARRSDTQSITGGIDYRFGNSFVAGMAISYSKLDSDFRSSTGDFSAKGLVYSLYGSGSVGPATLDAHISISQNSYDLRRVIAFTTAETTTDELAESHFRGRDYLAGIRGWMPFRMGNVTIALETGGLFLWSRVNPYVETGDGAFNLAVRKQQENLVIGDLGLEASTKLAVGNMLLTPHLGAKFHLASGRDNRTVTSAFVADPLDRATIVLLSSSENDQKFYSTSLGLSVVTGAVSAELEYGSIWGLQDLQSHQFVLNLSMPF